MTKIRPISEVQTNLSNLVKGVSERHDRVVITRKDQPAAVLISVEEYEGLCETLDILSAPEAIGQIGI